MKTKTRKAILFALLTFFMSSVYSTNPASTQYVDQKIAQLQSSLFNPAYIAYTLTDEYPGITLQFNSQLPILFNSAGLTSTGGTQPTYNAETGVFTVHKTGVYTINYTLVTSMDNRNRTNYSGAQFIINAGSFNSNFQAPFFSTSAAVFVPANYLVSLQAGDTILVTAQISYYDTAGGVPEIHVRSGNIQIIQVA